MRWKELRHWIPAATSMWKVHVIHLSSHQQRQFLTNRSKSLEKSVPKSDMGVWDIRLAPQVLEKHLCSLSSITCCRHILWGAAHTTPISIMGAQNLFFFARKSSLDWGCMLRTGRPEELDETWFQLHYSSRALISSPHGVVIKLKLHGRTCYSLSWFVSHPSLCLSSQILSIKRWKCFLVDELVVLNPGISLIWLFWDFDKIHGRVS